MTATPGNLSEQPKSADPIQQALDGVRLGGSIFLRGEYTEAWSFESPPPPNLAEALGVAGRRLLLFHIVVKGRC